MHARSVGRGGRPRRSDLGHPIRECKEDVVVRLVHVHVDSKHSQRRLGGEQLVLDERHRLAYKAWEVCQTQVRTETESKAPLID